MGKPCNSTCIMHTGANESIDDLYNSPKPDNYQGRDPDAGNKNPKKDYRRDGSSVIAWEYAETTPQKR